MTTRRVELSIEETTGCPNRRAVGRSGSGDPRPPAVAPDPEDPRPPAVVPDPEDPGEGAGAAILRAGPPADGGGGRASRLEPADYSGFIVVRVADRCLGCDGEEERGSGKREPRRGKGGGERVEEGPETPACRRLGERIEREAKLLECLEPDIAVGRPLCLRALAELVREHPPRPLIRSVAPAALRELERRAARTWLPPLHSLTRYCRIEACHLPLRIARELVALLAELPWVDLAYLELAATDPQGPALDVFTYASQQFYLDDAPVGLGVRRLHAEGAAGADGTGVRVIDLEQGWFLAHEDLAGPVPPPFYGANRPEGDPGYRGDHGTAVLGELGAAAANDLGVQGIVPGADLSVVSHWDAETRSNGHVADAVLATLAVLAGLPLARGGPAPDPPVARGDVLLLEVQRGRLPAEVDHADFDAVRLASALGLVVVEAAGNGGFDLDRYRDESGRRVLDRASSDFRESGAVVVGAARSALPHDRAGFSCFGSRVDCYGWGDGVVTTGYGDLAGDGDRDAYTRTFAGTSSASPMIAGVAAAVQAIAGSRGAEDRLAPRELRRALADPATGTPQGDGVPGRIGVMPDLPAVARRLGLVPEVFLADGALAVGAGGITLRLAHRGLGTAREVRATVYAAELSPLVPPERWRRVGTSGPVDLPQGARTAAAAGPVPLPPDGPSPASYLVVLHREPEPPPLPPGSPHFRFEDYLAFVRRHARRSLAETPAPAAGRPAELRFLLAGTADRPRLFDLELEQALPDGVRARLLVPRPLAGGFAAAGLLRDAEETRSEAVDGAALQVSLVPFRLPTRPGVALPRLRLGGASYPCRLTVSGLPRGAGAAFVLRQLHRGAEVGRIAWRIG